jgi:hypothetical protein
MKIFYVITVFVLNVLFFLLPAYSQDIADNKKLNCIQYAQLAYQKGWTTICVRLNDSPEKLCELPKHQIISSTFVQMISNNDTDKKNIQDDKNQTTTSDSDFVEQQVTLQVSYDIGGERSDIITNILQMSTPDSAFIHFTKTCEKFATSSRMSLLALPLDNVFMNLSWNFMEGKVDLLPIEKLFPKKVIANLESSCEYFFSYHEWFANSSFIYKNNICIYIKDIMPLPQPVSNHNIDTRPSLKDMIVLADNLMLIFRKEGEVKNITIKTAPLEQLSISVADNLFIDSDNQSGQSVVSWKLTSDPKHELYGAWVRCDVDAGTLAIKESKLDRSKLDVNNKIEIKRPLDNGEILISKIQQTGCNVTFYAITADGKTWYKRQIKIDPKSLTKKIIFPNDLEYRKFESFDGQYYIEAKLVSFEIDKDNKKIVILEKKEDHKKIPTHLNKLSKDDQNYIQEKIDTQKKNKLD